MRRWRWTVMLSAFALALAVASLPRSQGPAAPEQRIETLSAEIRCPTCAGLSSAESNSPLAESTREEISRQVREGRSNEEIRDYFVARYGLSALMSPPRRGLGAVVWLAAAVVLAAAVAVTVFALRRWRSDVSSGGPSEDDRAIVERALRESR